jgi:hypothetical protein
VYGLDLFLYVKFKKEDILPGQVNLIASFLDSFADAGSVTWPRHPALPASASLAIEIYDAARRKGATNDEIRRLAKAIESFPR